MPQRDDDPVGGDGLNRAANEVTTGFIGTWGGVLALALAAILLVADLGLGPFFLYAQAEHNGVELNLAAKATPWIFSVAMTGLLYALWETIGIRYSKQWIKWLAVAINIGDSLTDIGGANYLFTHDPEAGQKFWPPVGTPTQQVVLIYALGIACFFHEPLLGWLLGRYTAAIDTAAEFGDPGFGEKMEAFLVKSAGLLMNTVKFVGKMGATLALPALDLILTPLLINYETDLTSFVAVVALSVAMTAIQSRLWARTKEMGGIKAAIALSTKDKLMVYILGFLVIVDTYFDVRGYNQALYGDPGNIFNVIPEPTPSWFVTVGILIALCSFGELIGREIFTILGRKSRSIRRAKKGGGDADFGGEGAIVVSDGGGDGLFDVEDDDGLFDEPEAAGGGKPDSGESTDKKHGKHGADDDGGWEI
jgi:hypothetical protein